MKGAHQTHRLYFLLKGGKWKGTGSPVRVHGLAEYARKTPLLHIADEVAMQVDALEIICDELGVHRQRDPAYASGWIKLVDLPKVLRRIGWSEEEVRESMELLQPQHGYKAAVGKKRAPVKRARKQQEGDEDDEQEQEEPEDENDDDWEEDFIHQMKMMIGPESFQAFQRTPMWESMRQTMIEETLKEYDTQIRAHVYDEVEAQVREALRKELEPVVRARLANDKQLQMRLQQQEAMRSVPAQAPPRKDRDLVEGMLK